MSTYGVTATGFVMPTLAQIKADIQADYRAKYGTGADLSDTGPWGQDIGIATERELLIWQGQQAAYSSLRPDAVLGVAQDTLYGFNGVKRLPATASTAVVACTGTSGTVLPAGRVVSVVGSGRRFASAAIATIGILPAFAHYSGVNVGDRYYCAAGVYQATSAGTIGTNVPTGTDPTADYLVDGIHWRFLGAGRGAVDVVFLSLDLGPIFAGALSLSVIETAVSGWSAALNLLDATLGRAVELDSAFRARREQSLHQAGNAAIDAMRAAILNVQTINNPVSSCSVFENTTDMVDSVGRPPHSIEALVVGGADADVALAVWRSKTGGAPAFGTGAQAAIGVLASDGSLRTAGFSRPTQVPVYVIVNGTYDPSTFPADGVTEIQDAIAVWAASHFPIGHDVGAGAILAQVLSVPGVDDDCPLPFIGVAASPGSSNPISIDSRSQASFDTSRILVALTPRLPS